MAEIKNSDALTIGLAQIAPVWLDRSRTLEKILDQVHAAAEVNCQLVAFGEALLPGYPFWVERTDGAKFNSPVQKEIYAHYLDQAVQLEAGHMDPLCEAAKERHIAVVLGIIERPADRGGHSVYASLVYIDSEGVIQSVHRKLTPTYEERLVWSPISSSPSKIRIRAHTAGRRSTASRWSKSNAGFIDADERPFRPR